MPGLSLVLDVLILVLLGATIFYAIRLSRHLDVFRSNRSDMERLIRELSTQITRAQEGITALDEAAKESGDELRALVTRAQSLSDELSLINEAGNSLAQRLESLATKNRVMIDELGQNASSLVYPGSRPLPPPPLAANPSLRPSEAKEQPTKSSLFSIRDPDFEADDDDKKTGVSASTPVFDRDEADQKFETQAERDLAAAMRRRNKMLGES